MEYKFSLKKAFKVELQLQDELQGHGYLGYVYLFNFRICHPYLIVRLNLAQFFSS